MTTLSIGQVAKQTGVTHDTIRLYERYGLIEEPPRAANGYRQYPESAVARLCFIKRAKLIGFTLKEIGELLEIRRTSKNTCDDVRSQAEEKLDNIETKIKELQRLKKALNLLIKTCRSNHIDTECPLLNALGKQPRGGSTK